MKKSKGELVLLTGGLGNQIFQYAYLLNANSTNKFLVCGWGKPRLNSSGQPEVTSFQLEESVVIRNTNSDSTLIQKSLGYCLRSGFSPRRFERKPITVIAKAITSILVSANLKKIVFIKAQQDLGFDEQYNSSRSNFRLGYFQSYRWASNSDTYQKLMAIDLCEDESVAIFKELSKTEKPVIVHFRYGDYLNEKYFGIPSIEYYRAAVEKIVLSGDSERNYWIFSDDIDKARVMADNLGLNRCRFFSKEDLNSAQTLQVMRFGYDYVMANSTFSWWGAFLTYNPEAHVIAPTPWFQSAKEPKDLIPPTWERISSHFSRVR